MDFNWTNYAFELAGSMEGPIARACRLDARFLYFLYLPRGTTPGNVKQCHLAVVVHGTFRDAEKLKNSFIDFAEQTNTIILAPLFPCGILERQDINNYKFIRFHDIRFDSILLDMVDDVCDTFGLQKEQFLLYGFSGGGQFAHRMLYLHPQRILAVVICAPGRVTYLNKECPWPDGVQNMEEVFGQSIDFAALQKTQTLLLIGAEDKEVVDYSTDPQASHDVTIRGSNRLERVRALKKDYEKAGIPVTLVEVPGAAHEEPKLLGAAKEFLKNIVGPRA